MSNAETDTPDVDVEQGGDGDECPGIHVSAGIHTCGAESLHANAIIPPDATPEQVAAVLLRTAAATAGLYGWDTWVAFQHRVNGATT